jgi:hypothetical protein
MPNRRFTRGITLPSLLQWVLAGAIVCGGWLLWTEFRERSDDPSSAEARGTSVAELQHFEELADRGGESVPLLVKRLSDSDSRTRRNALYALGRIGPDAGAALGNARERLADPDSFVRIYAIAAFCRIGRDPDDIVASVAPLLADRDPTVRLEAGKALAAVGVDATRPLVSELQNDPVDVRVGAIRALRAIHASPPEAEIVDAIRGRLDQLDRTTRIHALAALADWKVAHQSEIRELLHSEPVKIESATFFIRTTRLASPWTRSHTWDRRRETSFPTSSRSSTTDNS